MRKFLYLVIFLTAAIASAQTTTVTGTVTDSDSIAWQNGTISFTLTSNNPNIPPTVGGVPLTPTQINFTIPLDGTGSFSTTVADTNFVQPISLWSIKICSNTTAPCATLVNMQIKGGSQNLTPTITSQIQAIRLPAGYATRAYADLEITTPTSAGATYYNTVQNITRQWNGTAWTNSGGGSISAIYVPVENYGAKGDGVTNDCNALQACLTATTNGQCFLGFKTYFIGSACTLLINKSVTGFVGSGIVEVNSSLFVTPPGSMILSASPSADIIDAWGADGTHNIYGNIFRDFTMARSVMSNSGNTGPPASGPAGLSVKYSYGAIIDHTSSLDSGFGYFFHAVGSGGVGYINNNIAEYGYNGLTETTGEYTGFWWDSYNGEPSPSVRTAFNHVASNGLSPFGPNVLGYVLSGSAYNDFMGENLETAGLNYGDFINTTGATGIGAQDIHLRNTINDADNFSCIYITGATTAMTSTVDIDGGWCQVQANNSPAVHILGSNNVGVRGLQITGNSSMTNAIQVDTTSSNVSLVNNNILTPTGGISLQGGSDYTVRDNLLHGSGTGTLFSLTSSPAHIMSGGNVFSGTGTGVNVAAGTSDMKGLEHDTFDTGFTNTIISAIPFVVPPLGTEVVTFSATPTFSYLYKTSIITLTANITSFTLAAGADTEAKTLIFCENATGGFTVSPPANVRGLTVGTTLSKCTTAYLVYNANQAAWMTQGEVQNQ